MKFEFSAGGVVYKIDPSTNSGQNLYILLGQHSAHHGWVFPKGLIGDKIKTESKEQTAIREVKEETGIDAKIIEALTPVVYWYNFEEEKRKKTVYYFIMKAVGGNIKEHDWEMENVKWVELEEVEKTLTYSSDKKVWKEAKDKIQRL